MFESLFELLFKYRPVMFEQGEVALRAAGLGYLLSFMVAIAAVITVRTYRQVRGNSKSVDRLVLSVFRVGALALLVFCLLRPVLIISSVVPQENFLGVLIDTSKSMQISDTDGVARSEFVSQQFGDPESGLRAALEDRFAGQ